MPINPVVNIVKFGNFLADELTKEKNNKKKPKTNMQHINYYKYVPISYNIL